MTDNEIIKSLECCGNENFRCDECPCQSFLYSECYELVTANALDLINRQQAEIERLQKENNQFADIGKMYSEIKAEAIKEFAERLKEKPIDSYRYDYKKNISIHKKFVDTEDIDNLLKEMVGDAE